MLMFFFYYQRRGTPRILVVGAGVIGMTSALQLLERG
jgi:glycine/D-amino acid oxidase-like deaminating enzyme